MKQAKHRYCLHNVEVAVIISFCYYLKVDLDFLLLMFSFTVNIQMINSLLLFVTFTIDKTHSNKCYHRFQQLEESKKLSTQESLVIKISYSASQLSSKIYLNLEV